MNKNHNSTPRLQGHSRWLRGSLPLLQSSARIAVLVLAAAALLTTDLVAQDSHQSGTQNSAQGDESASGSGADDRQGPPSRFLAIGAAALVQAEAYRDLDDDVEIEGIPLITYQDRRFSLFGPRAGVRVGGNESWDFRWLVEWDFTGYDPEDSDFFDGMEKRSSTLASGFSLEYEGGGTEVELSVLHDVLDRNGGYVAEISLSLPRGGRQWNVTPGISLTYQSEDYSDYYFGVELDEATAERPAYLPGATTEISLDLQLRRSLQGRWFLFGFASHTFLDDAVKDSPLVDRSSQTTAILGLAYRIY